MWIHIVFIPTIVMCTLALLQGAPTTRFLRIGGVAISTPILVWCLVCAKYLLVDKKIGMLCLVLGLIGIKIVSTLNGLDEKENLFGGKLFRFWAILKAVAWILQFVGHGVFEKRAPALITNLGFASIAPFFACFEVVNMLTGYKAEEVKEWNKVVEADIAAYRQSKGLPMRPGVNIECKDK